VRVENTTEYAGAEFVNASLSGARFENVDFTGVVAREAMLVNARFSGLIAGMVVNDVEVAPLIAAEMDRRYPERTKLRPTDAAGVRAAWEVIEGLWAATKQRVDALPEDMLHVRVNGEWSFLESMRHLVFVTDGWISGAVLRRDGQFHPFGVPPSFITDVGPIGIDPTADPPRTEVVAARENRMAIVAELVAGLRDDDLQRPCGEHTMLHCLLVLFDEEWHHNWYANRDLDTLTDA
jgi:hypothetical protein